MVQRGPTEPQPILGLPRRVVNPPGGPSARLGRPPRKDQVALPDVGGRWPHDQRGGVREQRRWHRWAGELTDHRRRVGEERQSHETAQQPAAGDNGRNRGRTDAHRLVRRVAGYAAADLLLSVAALQVRVVLRHQRRDHTHIHRHVAAAIRRRPPSCGWWSAPRTRLAKASPNRSKSVRYRRSRRRRHHPRRAAAGRCRSRGKPAREPRHARSGHPRDPRPSVTRAGHAFRC